MKPMTLILSSVAVLSLFAATVAAEEPPETPIDICICNAVNTHLKPTKNNGKTHLQGSDPTVGLTDADLKAFADAVRKCVTDAGKTSYDATICCMVDGQPMSVAVNIQTKNGASSSKTSNSADLVVSVGGPGTNGAPGGRSGGSATALASGTPEQPNSGGATVAVGGNGEANEASPGNGGRGTATSRGGGSAFASGGSGGNGVGSDTRGKGGKGKAKSQNGCGAGQQAGAKGGAGSDPANNPDRGGDGGAAEVEINGLAASENDGGAGAPGTPAGTHGSGATATGGVIGGVGPATSTQAGTPATNV